MNTGGVWIACVSVLKLANTIQKIGKNISSAASHATVAGTG